METKAEATTQLHAPISAAIRRCKRPGCTTELIARNRSGLCSKHCHWKGGERRPGASNGHAAARPNGTNGHASTGTNGSNEAGLEASEALPELSEGYVVERLDLLLLGLPAAEKARIASKWLRGEL